MTQTLRNRLFVLAGVVLVVLLSLCFAATTRAYAKYSDASSQYPADRDLSETAAEGLAAAGETIYGGALSASDIVSGTYVVPAYTSSRMCNFYASREDATAKRNPNHALISVSGGVITATFYLSGAYTAVYFGSAEQAASIAPAGGMTPAGAYITDGSLDYNTGHGPFTVTLSTLNTEFIFSVFNGGTKGVESALWYTRSGSFIATASFAETYSLVGPVKPDDGDNSNNTPGGSGTGGSGGSPAPTPAPQQPAEQPAPAQNPVAADPSVPHGKLISFVPLENDGPNGSGAILEGNVLSLEGLTTEQIALLLGAAVALAGAVAFFVRFRLQLRTPQDARDIRKL